MGRLKTSSLHFHYGHPYVPMGTLYSEYTVSSNCQLLVEPRRNTLGDPPNDSRFVRSLSDPILDMIYWPEFWHHDASIA